MLDKLITVVIPTSPIPSHPTTTLIEQTVDSVRHHLPHCRIMIQMDGVRPEQEKFREAYEEYKHKIKLKASGHDRRHWPNTIWVEFASFEHQAAMMKTSIPHISTPFIFYVEHDLPLLPDWIDFEGIAVVLDTKYANLVRLHYWSQILDDHKHLMLDERPVFVHGVPLVRTTQYSQHPHVARIDFYSRLLSHFSAECRTMIETKAYSLVVNAPWEEWKCAIYAPEPNLRRIWHTHGREEEPKWEEKFVF